MITKVQSKTFSRVEPVKVQPRLTALERAMLKWAVVDPDDRVLDANVGSGLMAEYLRRNMQCEVCGVSDNMSDVRHARERLKSCDIVYAVPGDIPWRENAFDTVLLKVEGLSSAEALRRTLKEALRVLKPGGQLVLGMPCYPAPVGALVRLVGEGDAESVPAPDRHEMMRTLRRMSFERATWQRTGIGTGVLTAWKDNPHVEELRSAQ